MFKLSVLNNKYVRGMNEHMHIQYNLITIIFFFLNFITLPVFNQTYLCKHLLDYLNILI